MTFFCICIEIPWLHCTLYNDLALLPHIGGYKAKKLKWSQFIVAFQIATEEMFQFEYLVCSVRLNTGSFLLKYERSGLK